MSNPHYKYNVNDYDNLYKLPKYAFKLAGVRLTCDDSKFFRIFWQIYYWLYFSSCLIGATSESINMVFTYQSGNVQDLFLMMPCVGFVLVAVAKSYKMVWYRSIFENLIAELRAMWPHGVASKEEHDILCKMIKQLTFIIKGYFCCNVFLIFFFTSPPFVQIAKRAMGRDVPLIFSFKYWMPFDQFQPVYYEIMLIIQTLQCFTIVLLMLSADLLFFLFLSNIVTQFDLLAVRIRRMTFVEDQLRAPLANSEDVMEKYGTQRNASTSQEWENIYLNEIRDIVTRHQALIRLAGDVESMYTFSLLINFINSSIIICFCGFCCVFVEKWNELIYKLFLTSAISQVWMLCWYGQHLLDSSVNVADALYTSGWYNASQKIRSSILIMLHRSQREVHITTYGFSVVSLKSYTTIIKTSWSYFTLLINTYNQ